MRTGVLVSLLVHGAAAAALVLWGPAPAAPEPLGWIAVSARADDAPEPEPQPSEPAPPAEPPAPAESWPIPEETPAPPEIEAPEEGRPVHGDPHGFLGLGGVRAERMPPFVRLRTPLRRPARRTEPATAAALPAAGPSRAPEGVLREPRLLADSPRARYPARARRLGLEGTVMLLLHVSADGTVDRVEVATPSGHEILDRAAAKAAALWRFEPARKDGTAIACDVRVPVEFALADA